MLKILSVAFVGHPVLGNLELDFCDESGNPADTILIAGENGTGKSSILEALYGIVSRSRRFFSNMVVVYQLDDCLLRACPMMIPRVADTHSTRCR